MRVSAVLLSLAAVIVIAPERADAHGMVMDPVNRGSMWRKGYPTPVYYSDNQQYCGGFSVQWYSNGGKCGECGDDYSLPRPRPSENGGTYGTGIPVATYKAGQAINITVQITANHRGRFLFKLCCLDDKGQLEEQECFEKNILQLTAGGTEYPLPNSNAQDFVVEVLLPSDVTGELCVLQWTYITASNWGWCDDDKTHGALGCGDEQETYRTCSDITIV